MTTATIRYFQPRSLLIGLVMLLAAGLAVLMTPSRKIADGSPAMNLEAMIPKAFGEWKVDESATSLPVAPDIKAKLDRIYSQTLARTYVNGKGERVMLSIAYGGDQSDSMQVHKPEICYPSQGFQLMKDVNEDTLSFSQGGQIKVQRLVATLGLRIEPITYWIRVGGKVTAGNVERKIEQIRFALTGKVPDGLLFRISTLNKDEKAAYRLHDEFIRSIMISVDPDTKYKLIGTGV